MTAHPQYIGSAVASNSSPLPYPTFDGQYIGGKWTPGMNNSLEIDTDPYSGETLAEIKAANANDLDLAFKTASLAQKDWALRLPAERTAIMLRAAAIMEHRHDEIVNWIVRESGSTLYKAELEWWAVHAITVEAASFPHRIEGRILPLDEPHKESRSYRSPLGVVGVISPWNFPMYLSHRSIGPALALGNGVVVKPANDTPVTGGLLIARIFEEAGLPSGLLNVVVGPVDELGDAFTLNPIPKLISFTGSTKIGRRIGQLAISAPRIKRVSLELGGNGPCVILDDADLEHAVRATAVGRFLHQGQVCMSTNRIIVDAKVYDEFVDRFVSHVKGLKYGDPKDPAVAIGPVINKKQLDGHLDHINGALSAGAQLVVGGPPNGLVLPPHVLLEVRNDMAVAQDELFGPIAPIIKAENEADALRIANDTQYGLSSAVFTRDHERGLKFALGLEIGMTHINDHSVDDAVTGPFGGEKNSGIGRFGGEWIIREFTRDHWITVNSGDSQLPF